MNPTDIIELREELKGKASTRESLYDEIENACGGSFEDRAMEGAFPKDEPASTPDRIDSDRENPEIVVNLLWPIIEAKRAFIGQIPNVRVPKPPSGNIALAEKAERVILGIWNFSNMSRRFSDIGLYCPAYGTAVGVVWPDLENERPRILIRSPRGFYPTPKDDDGYELFSAIFVSKYTGKQAAKLYNKKQLADYDDVEILQYIDDKEITTVSDDGLALKTIRHKLGFCPIVSIPNIGWPNSPFGESDIARALKLQKEVNYTYGLNVSIMEHILSQPIILEGAENFPEDGLPMGPRDTVEITMGGRAYRLPPLSVPYDMFRIQQDLQSQLNSVSDAPAALRSEWDNSGTVTGRAFTSMLGPVQARMKIRLDTIYPAIEKLNRMCFQMYEAMFPGDHSVYGWQNKKPFTETFNIKEFEGWYENDVFLDPAQFFDEQSRFVMILQGIQNQIISKETARRHFPLIDDAEAEREQINKEVMENIQQAQAAQMAAESPATMNAPMNEPGKTAFSLERGYLGEVPPASIPGGLGEMTGGSPTGGTPSEDVVVQQAADLMRDIPKIHGNVYLVGGIIDGVYGPDENIEIALTDNTDKQTISNYVRTTAPELHGKMEFLSVTGTPDEPYIDCSPGTSGYDIQNKEDLVGTENPESPEAGLLMGGIPEAGKEEQAQVLEGLT